MKSFVFSLSAMLFLLVSCAAEGPQRIPDLEGARNPQEKQACAELFPQGTWQFVHSIVFSMKSGVGSTVIGVTSLSGTDIESALVTVEGLTLFEAVFHGDNSFEIRRGVPPFDNPGFAEGLLRDVRAIFQPPGGSNVQTGQLADKTSVCRYTAAGGEITDVMTVDEGCLQIKSYTSDLILERSIIGTSCRKAGSVLIPEYIELETPGPAGYTLKMTLISADQI